MENTIEALVADSLLHPRSVHRPSLYEGSAKCALLPPQREDALLVWADGVAGTPEVPMGALPTTLLCRIAGCLAEPVSGSLGWCRTTDSLSSRVAALVPAPTVPGVWAAVPLADADCDLDFCTIRRYLPPAGPPLPLVQDEPPEPQEPPEPRAPTSTHVALVGALPIADQGQSDMCLPVAVSVRSHPAADADGAHSRVRVCVGSPKDAAEVCAFTFAHSEAIRRGLRRNAVPLLLNPRLTDALDRALVRRVPLPSRGPSVIMAHPPHKDCMVSLLVDGRARVVVHSNLTPSPMCVATSVARGHSRSEQASAPWSRLSVSVRADRGDGLVLHETFQGRQTRPTGLILTPPAGRWLGVERGRLSNEPRTKRPRVCR